MTTTPGLESIASKFATAFSATEAHVHFGPTPFEVTVTVHLPRDREAWFYEHRDRLRDEVVASTEVRGMVWVVEMVFGP